MFVFYTYINMQAFNHLHYVGIQRHAPEKPVVHIFDLDDTLTLKPTDFDNKGMSKDDFFDCARSFTPDGRITWLLRWLHEQGDAIAVCTARPPERLTESYQWLRKWLIPFDVLMLSTGVEASNISKQHMIKYLRKEYNCVGTMYDDSIYNIEGARLQGVSAIHIPKNEDYWTAHPETVVKV